MSLNPITAIILSWIKSIFLRVSMTDGKPGLSVEDLKEVVEQVKVVKDEYDDAPEHLKGAYKHNALAMWIEEEYKGQVSPWVAKLLGFLAYLYAKRKGVI